ncbi:MAG: 6-phosphogluconolactonase [Candidatus Cryptobacteroides sp.]|nr:6-phosphogluconolactonase [Bacteroidales bacterium]MDD7118196.1 6-phosphogluconolactonase [Bacteroidales bacterium]MDY5443775.1 6-phosphogluconolactonase [Candidatus Cryptobacteroides sp.]MDY6183558.1 6-phosphogluconolactonase [Candidatus Cryptobacteroides sp.]
MKHFTLPKEGGLIEKGIPADILHGFERIRTEIYDQSSTASDKIADIIVNSINACRNRNFRLGLTTGSTPASLYTRLKRAYDEGRVSFRNVEVYSIDEYYPYGKDEPQSRNMRLRSALLDGIDIPEENIHIPDGSVPQERISEYCAEYDKAFRGLDLLVIGMGEQGQIGFNEAGTSLKSRTRTVLLSYQSRKRQGRFFNGDFKHTPAAALTVGLDTIMTAGKIILMAWGEDKAEAVKRVAEMKPDSDYPASLLQAHPDITCYTDETGASLLTRVVSPWMVGPCDWTRKFMRKAVVWLCQEVHKPILKLTQKDYLEHSLGELLDRRGPYDKINIDVFNDLQHTITGWPGGKPDADDSQRPVSAKPYPKKVLIFSPHPDDDVISMGGTFIRLVHQGHDVHVAYETSGDLAVHDDVVLQHMDAAHQLGFADEFDRIKAIIDSKVPGEPEPKELLAIKGAIRRSEARGADRSFGLNDNTNVHFLDLPFYESGGVKKMPRTQADLDIIKDLLKRLRPDQVFMAGDLADPHGTHRVCTEAALEAIEQLKEEGETWLENTHVWLYRGAWMEWEIGRVDMAVPLSPDEVVEKRHAIFRHLSQKDIVPFPGDDPREFWQRAEDRTQNTARIYDELGMAEYQAMEVFLKLY